MPLLNPDFSPYLQRVRDAAPDTFFTVVPNNQAVALVKQFLDSGMDKSGTRLVSTGDLTPDDDLLNMREAMVGLVTAHHYSKFTIPRSTKPLSQRSRRHIAVARRSMQSPAMTRCISSTRRS